MNLIDTPDSFREAVLALLDEFSGKYEGSLEEYLRSLWIVINENQCHEPSYALFLAMLEEAFRISPAEFDPQWLEYNKPPSWSFRDGEYVSDALEGTEVAVIERDVDEFRILKHTILFQIADLYRMRENQLKNEHRYLGVKSPTGYSWYNFDVFMYLECATGGVVDHSKGGEKRFAGCDWVNLAVLLELGRLYE